MKMLMPIDCHRAMKMFLSLILGAILLLGGAPLQASALRADETLSDQQLNRRALNLYREVRCVVCQNESLADSTADVASDMRRDIRESLQRQQSDQQIRDALVNRYGDYVLFRPRLSADTALLWLQPFVVIIIGLFAFFQLTKKRPEGEVDEPDEAH